MEPQSSRSGRSPDLPDPQGGGAGGLPVFYGAPSHPGDPRVEEWVEEARALAARSRLSGVTFFALLKASLGGRALQEITARGDSLGKDPEALLAVVIRVFGGPDTLTSLQEQFQSYRQGSEGVLDCSLHLATLYDRMVAVNPHLAQSRETTLKGQLAVALRDAEVRAEVRRLAVDKAHLAYLQLRDELLDWLRLHGRGEACGLVREASLDTKAALATQLDLVAKHSAAMERLEGLVDSLQSKVDQQQTQHDRLLNALEEKFVQPENQGTSRSADYPDDDETANDITSNLFLNAARAVSLREDIEKAVAKVTGCRVSFQPGKLCLSSPRPELRDKARKFCAAFDQVLEMAEGAFTLEAPQEDAVPIEPQQSDQYAMSSASLKNQSPPSAEIPCRSKHGTPSFEVEEIEFNAGKKLFPRMFRDASIKRCIDGKVQVSSTAHDEIMKRVSCLQRAEVEVGVGDEEKAKSCEDMNMDDSQVYIQYVPQRKIIVVVGEEYDCIQRNIHKIRIHLGRYKPTSRGRRKFAPPGTTGVESGSATAAAAATGGGLSRRGPGGEEGIALPGGLTVIPYKADITKLKVDAIVNNANEHLSHGGGVARAISRAAGPDFDRECDDYVEMNGTIPVSEVAVTGPGNLPCSMVIHAVGPWWDPSKSEMCQQQLYDTILNCLNAASRRSVSEVALPAISSGIFGMPQAMCTAAYARALISFDKRNPSSPLTVVHFVDIKDDLLDALRAELRKQLASSQHPHAPKSDHGSTASTADRSLQRKSLRGTEDGADLGDCCICLSTFTQPVKLRDCAHVFCRNCIEVAFRYKPACPTCGKIYEIITGDMPPGTMRIEIQRTFLPGNASCGTIIIYYNFPDGVQKEEHPSPGRVYRGISRTAYLPDSPEGRKVLRLLHDAFDRRLTFTIGWSVPMGRDGVITWNDIHHKTLTSGSFGYPDSDYLKRVQEELAARGVTEASIQPARSGKSQDFSQFFSPVAR